jgi:PadR family transcriptional regulator PadR
MNGQQLKGNLDLLLLATLERGARHGYAIISELRDRSEGAFDLAEGTVYPALHRLEREGHVSSRWSNAEGRRRRLYQLTGAGAVALQARRHEWRDFARGVQAVLGLGLAGRAGAVA